MAYIDLLLHIDSYPKPTPPAAIEEAVRVDAVRAAIVAEHGSGHGERSS